MEGDRARTGAGERGGHALRAEAGVMGAIECGFPGWRVWRSGGGGWWATRTGRDAHCDRDDPRPMCVDAADAEGLRAALTEAEDAAREAFPAA